MVDDGQFLLESHKLDKLLCHCKTVLLNLTRFVSIFSGLSAHTMRIYVAFRPWGISAIGMNCMVLVPLGMELLGPLPRHNLPISLAQASIHSSLAEQFFNSLYSAGLPVSGFIAVL